MKHSGLLEATRSDREVRQPLERVCQYPHFKFWPPEMWWNEFVFFKLLLLWEFVAAAPEN